MLNDSYVKQFLAYQRCSINASWLMNTPVTGWPVVRSYLHVLVLLLMGIFFVLPVRLHKVYFWGLASSPPSVPGCEFWALASQLTWCWLLVDSPLGIVPGLPGILLGWAPGTHRTASLSPQGHTRLGIPLWTGTELYSPWHWYPSPSGANFLNDESVRASICQCPLSELGFSYKSQWCHLRECLLLNSTPPRELLS